MLLRFVALVLIPSMCAAQSTSISSQLAQSSSGTARQSPISLQGGDKSQTNITVPQGSMVALKLISTIKRKSTHPGDPVRAVVAFPLAIEARVAIPAGTFVEGVVEKVNARASGGSAPSVQLRFNRLLFANGYSVPLVAANTQAIIPKLSDPRRTGLEFADARDGAPYLGEAFVGQNPPQLPPLPSMGPSPGALAGIGIGTGVGILVLTLAISHHRAAGSDYILFDSGWQFQMALEEPLTLDATQVSAVSTAK